MTKYIKYANIIRIRKFHKKTTREKRDGKAKRILWQTAGGYGPNFTLDHHRRLWPQAVLSAGGRLPELHRHATGGQNGR